MVEAGELNLMIAKGAFDRWLEGQHSKEEHMGADGGQLQPLGGTFLECSSSRLNGQSSRLGPFQRKRLAR